RARDPPSPHRTRRRILGERGRAPGLLAPRLPLVHAREPGGGAHRRRARDLRHDRLHARVPGGPRGRRADRQGAPAASHPAAPRALRRAVGSARQCGHVHLALRDPQPRDRAALRGAAGQPPRRPWSRAWGRRCSDPAHGPRHERLRARRGRCRSRAAARLSGSGGRAAMGYARPRPPNRARSMHRPRQSPSPARERRRVAVLVVLALGGCPKARAPEPVDPAPPPAPSTAATEDWHDVQERALAAMWRDLDPDAAREAFERVVVLQPDEASTYHHLSMLYADEGAWTEAIAAAERYVALAPEDPERLDALGEVLLMAGRLDDAAAAFGRALDRAPGFPLAHEGVAYVHFHRGEWAAGWS